MKDQLNGANLMTSGSLVAGFVALLLATQGEFAWAAGAIGVAAVLDSLDGVVARRLDACGPFGSQLDSLADLVSFGVAPALMLQLAVLDELPVAGVGACMAFVVGGAWRLARFPLVEERHRFVGLPIPPAGLLAAVAAAWWHSPGWVLALTLVLSVLMVSAIPFPTLRTLTRRLRRGMDVEESPLAQK